LNVAPAVCGLFLTAWDIDGTAFKDILPPVKSLRSGDVKEIDAPLDDIPPAKQ